MSRSHWHALDILHVLEQLQTSRDGLGDREAKRRLQLDGPNLLPTAPPPSAWRIFFRQISDPIIGILCAAGFVHLVLHNFVDAGAILFVVLFNAILGFLQEKKAESSLSALKKLVSPKAKVLRDDLPEEIDTSEIVIGDVLLLESGVKICADARIIESQALEIDESTFTGESSPTHKNNLTQPESASIFEQKNMLFSGTTVTRGRARAVVVETGKNTKLGTLISSTQTSPTPTSPLQQRLHTFGNRISIFTLSLMAVVIFLGYLENRSLYDLLMTCVSLTVSAVPEGLPIAVTATLSIGLLRMAERKAVIKRLPAVETLGCTTVICTDKTGTLTENTMKVQELRIGATPSSLLSQYPHSEALQWSFRILWWCSETKICDDGSFVGDPVEAALMRYAKESLHQKEDWECSLILPFEPELRMMATAISNEQGSFTLWKGAFEALAPGCTYMFQGYEVLPFQKEIIEKEYMEMTQQGLRVLALAYKKNTEEVSDQPIGLTLVGLIGLNDPPREEAASSVHKCQEAGIRVVMITGDHPETARAIADNIGLNSSNKALTGAQIDTLNDQQLAQAVSTTSIFARTDPIHKLRIVQQLQGQGEVVAMTGDGVNDVPSLRQADIGIAMGSGTDVAKETASMVILDNNFSSIVEAVRHGRVIFRSLQKMAVYLLTTCFSGVITIVFAMLLDIPVPLRPLQLLWINLVTDGTTTIPLAMEGEHGNIMHAKPRKKEDPFLSKRFYMRSLLASFVMILGTIGIFVWTLLHSSLAHAQTIAFTTFAFFQMWNALNSRSVRRSLFFTFRKRTTHLDPIPLFHNVWLWITLLACVILQVLAVEWPYLQKVLQTTGLSLSDWITVITTSFTVVVAVEIQKSLSFFFGKSEYS
jgi:Ca2+-transporting ATPase